MTERMSDELKQAMKATPPEELYEYLMDCNIPKSEAEHYAADKIEELEAKVDRVKSVISDLETQTLNSHAVKLLRKALENTND